MKVLMIYPQYPETFWSFRHILKYISKKAAFPPLGLLTISAMLPATWKKKLIDVNVRKLLDADIKWADLILISGMIVQKDSAAEIIKRCKAYHKTIVAGGPLFTTRHQDPSFAAVDHFVLNEGEITLPRFLNDLEKGTPQKLYTATDRPALINTPIPDWSLISPRDYVTTSVQFSRGCPFNCEFCDIIVMNGQIPRTKSPAQLIAELQSLYEAGWRHTVFIVDDNFIGNKNKTKAMLQALIDWQISRHYPFKFFTEASINLADDEELLDLMRQANFYKVFIGFETPHGDSLEECNKMQNVKRDIAETVKKIHAHGIQVMGGFIVGFDSDPKNIFEEQIKFIQSIGVVTAMVGTLTALPGTALHQRLAKENRLTAESNGQNTDADVNFIPKIGKEKLIAGYRQVLASIYSQKNYYRRIRTFLKDYKPLAKESGFDWNDFSAFFKSIWWIGILSQTRWRYWLLIWQVSLTKPKALPVAVELTIMGKHFEKVTKTIIK